MYFIFLRLGESKGCWGKGHLIFVQASLVPIKLYTTFLLDHGSLVLFFMMLKLFSDKDSEKRYKVGVDNLLASWD